MKLYSNAVWRLHNDITSLIYSDVDCRFICDYL